MDNPANTVTRLGDRAVAAVDTPFNAADKAVAHARELGNAAADHLSDDVASLHAKTSAAVGNLAGDAGRLAQRGSDAWHQRSEQVRSRAIQARDTTVGYIQHRPVKAVLIAAAVGAGLMLLSVLFRPRATR